MKVARIAVLAIAAVAGLGAAMVAKNMNNAPAPQTARAIPAPKLDMVRVLVAAKDIGLGESMADGAVKWQDWPRASVTTTYITEEGTPDAENELQKAIARSGFMAGEPINMQRVAIQGKGFMSAILAPGKRAVSTEISEETGAGGFILPNDRVDVIVTRREQKRSGTGKYITETILQNVRVLAIDQTFAEQNGERVVVGKTATLELGPAQAETLMLADQRGTVTLALRAMADQKGDAVTVKTDEKRRSSTRLRVIKYGVTTEVQAR